MTEGMERGLGDAIPVRRDTSEVLAFVKKRHEEKTRTARPGGLQGPGRPGWLPTQVPLRSRRAR
jgi:hypothetical protein